MRVLWNAATEVIYGNPKSALFVLLMLVGWAGKMCAPLAVDGWTAWRLAPATAQRDRDLMLGLRTHKKGGLACIRGEEDACRILLAQGAMMVKSVADHGHHRAQLKFAMMACTGFGTEKNAHTAKFYFEQAKLNAAQIANLYADELYRACYMTKLT